MDDLFKAYESAKDILHPQYANLSPSEQLRVTTEKMVKNGTLTESKQKVHTQLINEQEKLEEEAMVDLLTKMLNKEDSLSGDIYGDGDQSPLKGNAAQKLRNQWSSGMDFHPNNVSYFYQACFVGDYNTVQKELNQSNDKKKLMEKRETVMRFNAVFCVVQGARLVPADDTRDTSGYAKCMKLLIENDANVHVKDVAGYSVLFHCVTAFGNFNETKKLAEILINAGASTNTQNRFGCTPLHENITMRRYEVLDFLIDNGADPSIADNDGITANGLALLLPKGQMLFSKAGFLLGSKKKQEAKSAGHGKCFACGKAKAKKRCTRCLAAYYCDRDCQVKHWQKHKTTCTKQEKDKINVNLSNGNGDVYSTINWNTGNVYTTNNNDLPDEKSFKVKVQVPIGDTNNKAPCLVYDKKRSFQNMIDSTDPSYAKIVHKIRTEGVMKAKGYFLASFNDDGKLSIQVEKMLPPQNW